MSYFSLNSKYVESKSMERLCSSLREENEKAVSDLSSITSAADLKQLKEVLRNTHWNIDHPIRQNLWETLCKKLSVDDDSDIYHEMEKDLLGNNYHPTSLPSFVDPAYCIRYHLNADGRKQVEKMLHIIRHVRPDITYCPVLYPLISLFLHYMPDGMAYSCIMKILADKQNFVSQTKADHASSAYLVMKLTKKYARNAYSQLDKELKEHEDFESMFQNWLSWIFKGLPFSYLVRVIDCFLVEKKKCLYRMVLSLLILYSKNSDKAINEDLGMLQKLLDYFQNISVPIDKVFKIAYGIRGFSEKVVNQQLLKVQMTLKSQSNLSERSVSVDRLSPTNPVYHVEMNSSLQPVVKESQSNLSERSVSVDRLSPTNPVYHVEINSSLQLVVKESESNLSERSVSVDRLSPTNPVYHMEMNSSLQPVVKESESNLSERSVSVDRLSPTNPVYHVEINSSLQPVVKELRMDSSCRARSVGVVALGNFKSEIITAEQMSLIWSWLPVRISMYQPEVIYSSNEHGVCLTAFYMKVGAWEPTVLVIKASNDEIFGAYCSSSWNSRNSSDSNNKKYTYFGTGESFLFTLVPEAIKYSWVGIADSNIPHSAKLFMAADNSRINVGAGNGQGLLLYDQLLHGSTEHCDTFNNEPLCSMKDFQCKIVEVIAFK